LPLPIVWRHRDFTPWNLFRAGNEIHVVDWEGLRPGPALCDLLHFVMHWHEQARRVSGRAALHDLFVAPRPGPAAAAAREEIANYCRQLEIDLRFVPLLLLHTRLEIVARRTERPAGAPGKWDTADAAYVTFLAEEGEALFEAWR
jgi:aminoglycoside phosphotransferase (APT) family kinase protein